MSPVDTPMDGGPVAQGAGGGLTPIPGGGFRPDEKAARPRGAVANGPGGPPDVVRPGDTEPADLGEGHLPTPDPGPYGMTPEQALHYERAMRGLQTAIDGWPMKHYAVPVSEEQVARDNARERKRLGIDPPEGSDAG